MNTDNLMPDENKPTGINLWNSHSMTDCEQMHLNTNSTEI